MHHHHHLLPLLLRQLILPLLLLVPSLTGAELKLPDSPLPPHQLIRLQVTDAEEVLDVLVITVIDNAVEYVTVEALAQPPHTYVFTGPPGIYSVRVSTKGNAPLVGRLEVRAPLPFPIPPTTPPPSSPPPSPPPAPLPPPTPPSTPPPSTPPSQPQKPVGTLILYSDSLTPLQNTLLQQLQNDPTLRTFLASNQHLLWTLPDTHPDAASWRNKTDQRPAAILFSLPDANSVYSIGPCPTSPSALIDLITRYATLAPPLSVAKVTYVYEQRETPIPPPVAKALVDLNKRGIVATVIDDDITNGRNIPAQYAATIPAARAAGLPALVVQASTGDIIRVLKAPTTAQQVLDAAQ